MTAACVGMIACSKDGTGDNPYADGSKQVVLKVNLPTTRAGVDGSWLVNGAPKETTISTIDVFFTNANGTVKNRYTLNTVNGYLDDVQGDGLRFVGLEDVTAVYIAANVPASISPSSIDNVADFQVLMNQQAPNMEQDDMIFAGCDRDLIAGADTDSKIPTYGNTDNQDPTVPAEGDMVYTTDVVIRPIISRIEWGDITVAEEGSKEFKQSDGSTYRVEWTGYKPTIVGVYQSNVYLAENIFGTTQASASFATPANWTSIVKGAWVEPNPSIDGITWNDVNLSLAYTVLKKKASFPIAYNAADEVAVQAFIDGKIKYTDIARVVKAVIDTSLWTKTCTSYTEIMEADALARKVACECLLSF